MAVPKEPRQAAGSPTHTDLRAEIAAAVARGRTTRDTKSVLTDDELSGRGRARLLHHAGPVRGREAAWRPRLQLTNTVSQTSCALTV